MSAFSDPSAREHALRERQSGLLRCLLASLPQLPGAESVELFGSLANGGGDGFSDMDLRVFTYDLAASIAARRQALSDVGPVLLEWRIWPAAEPFAAAILFRDESCYHKLDLGFRPAGGCGETSMGAAPEDPSEKQPYSPLVGSPGHVLMEQLLGATRYVKARKRGQNLTCWRFAAAAAEQVMRLIYESRHGWREVGTKLSTPDYLRLDAALSRDAALDVIRFLRFDSPQAMDASMLAMCQAVASLSEEKGVAVRSPIPGAPVAKLLGFLRAELAQEERDGERGT